MKEIPIVSSAEISVNINRFHSKFTTDLRFTDGQLTLKRESSEEGLFSKKGPEVKTKTIQAREYSDDVSKDLQALASKLFRSFGDSTLQLSHTQESKKINLSYESQDEWLYVNIENKLTHLLKFKNVNQSYEEISEEYVKWLNYEVLPDFQGDLQYDLIVVSQITFGHILHESLGHRLEGDDFDQALTWGPMPSMNFSVFDVPGDTPVDDNGTTGKEVCLFDPRTGLSELMNEESGNARATSFFTHPIIRQRCLEVNSFEKVSKPEACDTLYIDDVHLASYIDNETHLEVSRARISVNGIEFKLPPIELTLSNHDIQNLKAYGERKLIHPAGGCHKGLQRGLNISYHTPKAFLNIRELT